MLFYRLLSILLIPLIYFYLILRLLNKKEDPKRFKERFGFSNITRPEGKLIWIHCVSVGESNSALILLEELLKKDENTNILFTSTTVTSANQLQKKLSDNRIIHQFLPIDDYFSTKRFLKYWQPDNAIFVESEIWPNLIDNCAQNNIKLALINARISEKSFKRWQFLHKLGFNVLKNFQISFAQSQKDQEKLINLGLKETKFIGNLKSLAKTLKFDEEKLENLQKQINNRPFWLASSTHRGEEKIILRIHEKLSKYLPNILTIVAPRHPNRINEIKNLIPKNLNFALRSENEAINNNTALYIADTLGELGLFYKLSDISLICGSLKDNIGGHNPFEALKLDSGIISGQFVANFEEIYKNLEKNKSCILVKNEEELLFYILRSLEDKEFVNNLKENWQKLNEENNHILPQIIKEL